VWGWITGLALLGCCALGPAAPLPPGEVEAGYQRQRDLQAEARRRGASALEADEAELTSADAAARVAQALLDMELLGLFFPEADTAEREAQQRAFRARFAGWRLSTRLRVLDQALARLYHDEELRRRLAAHNAARMHRLGVPEERWDQAKVEPSRPPSFSLVDIAQPLLPLVAAYCALVPADLHGALYRLERTSLDRLPLPGIGAGRLGGLCHAAVHHEDEIRGWQQKMGESIANMEKALQAGEPMTAAHHRREAARAGSMATIADPRNARTAALWQRFAQAVQAEAAALTAARLPADLRAMVRLKPEIRRAYETEHPEHTGRLVAIRTDHEWSFTGQANEERGICAWIVLREEEDASRCMAYLQWFSQRYNQGRGRPLTPLRHDGACGADIIRLLCKNADPGRTSRRPAAPGARGSEQRSSPY
jgi:hypothetical protein